MIILKILLRIVYKIIRDIKVMIVFSNRVDYHTRKLRRNVFYHILRWLTGRG